MKEKIDRQLVGQNSLTPFMNMRDNLKRTGTFDTTDGIEQKLDKLTAMNKNRTKMRQTDRHD